MSVGQVTSSLPMARLSFKGEPCFSAGELASQMLTNVQLAPGRQAFQYISLLKCRRIKVRLPLQVG